VAGTTAAAIVSCRSGQGWRSDIEEAVSALGARPVHRRRRAIPGFAPVGLIGPTG
jgi:hypothetical protein